MWGFPAFQSFSKRISNVKLNDLWFQFFGRWSGQVSELKNFPFRWKFPPERGERESEIRKSFFLEEIEKRRESWFLHVIFHFTPKKSKRIRERIEKKKKISKTFIFVFNKKTRFLLPESPKVLRKRKRKILVFSWGFRRRVENLELWALSFLSRARNIYCCYALWRLTFMERIWGQWEDLPSAVV